MATAAQLISIDSYLHTAYRPDCDFVDGTLDFLAMGVQNLWIIDPTDRKAYTYSGTAELLGDRLTIPGTPIYLDIPTLFQSLD